MRNRWIRAVGVMTVLALPWTARGADHADGTPGTLFSPDATADITDVFAWMSPDAMKMKLVMDVGPGATTATRFSNVVKYVFHTNSKASFTATPTSAVDIICTFDAGTPQHINCWVVQGTTVIDFATGDPSATAGINSVNGKFKVFAGLRDDPFFFNLAGFKKTTQAAARAGTLPADSHGCPSAASTVAGLLNKDCTGAGTAQDFFAPRTANDDAACSALTAADPHNHALTGNVLAIAILIDKTAINQGGAIVGVWGATTH